MPSSGRKWAHYVPPQNGMSRRFSDNSRSLLPRSAGANIPGTRKEMHTGKKEALLCCHGQLLTFSQLSQFSFFERPTLAIGERDIASSSSELAYV